MQILDYNGSGVWSAEGIAAKYQEYSRKLRLAEQVDLQPRVHEQGGRRWVYPVMDRVIEGIEAGDPACAEIGIDFICQDASFAFGMRLKANTARALRRAELSKDQQERIRRRVLEMLMKGYVPKEYREYAKLLRKVGIAKAAGDLDRANKKNPYVAKYIKYFKSAFSECAV